MSDPLKPSPTLLAKLGSILVHAEEATSPDGHGFDFAALGALTDDSEVIVWRRQMEALAMLPVKRHSRPSPEKPQP